MSQMSFDEAEPFHVHVHCPVPGCTWPDAPPNLNVVGKARQGQPDTARAAAKAVKPRSGSQRWFVLVMALKAWPDGILDEEWERALAARSGRSRQHTPRRLELVEGGWMKDSGRTRKSENGKDSEVWVATQKAIDVFGTEGPW